MRHHTLLGPACDQMNLIRRPPDTIISIEPDNCSWLMKISSLDPASRRVKRWSYWEVVKLAVQETREDGSCQVNNEVGLADIKE